MSNDFRLPRSVLPRRYDLEITPDLDASAFSGRVVITADVVEATPEIVLNARGLDVTVEEPAATIATNPQLEQIIITPAEPLQPGPLTLTLAFTGSISAGLLGFYRSTYTDDAGASHTLAATQFEAPHARAAFPCFDEPEFKAVFGITLNVRPGLLAISNGPEIERVEQDGWVRIRYGDTISMSTYLVAWVVGPLEVTPPVDAGGVALRVVHAPGKGHLTAFALDVGKFALEFFSDYYGIPFPGSKCDLVALPDFSFGAMENLGCVTFRETRLLLDPAEVTLDEMSAAGLTIVHEIAHMWFGDLVTMKWWNGIWLNEAFATFMERLGTDAHHPEWRTWDDFAVGRAAALDVDALSSTRTVEYEVVTPQDAEGMFDTLTYQKGGSVLRMLERWLGADAFRAGVRHYLETYKFGNTETTDLWDALEDATGKPVRQIMDSWIFQPGFPVLRPSDGRVVQERFTYLANPNANERYVVPLLVRVNGETSSVLLANDVTTLDAPADALVVLNAGGAGFYRVAYPAEWRTRLLDAGVLEPRERFSLIDDLGALVLAGEARADELLDAARRFGDETELVVWRILGANLRAMARLVEGDALEQFRAEVTEIVAPAMARLGWTGRDSDDARVRQLRGLVISLMGTLVCDPSAVGRAREIVERPASVDADVAAAAIGVVASVGTEAEFEEYLDRSARGASPQEKLRYQYALGEFPSEELVLRAASMALSTEVRPQDAPFVLQRALRNRELGPAAWVFIRDHWDDAQSRMTGALLSRMLEGATWLVDDASVADIPRFIASHPVPSAARTIEQTLDRLRIHRAVVDRERARFTKLLLERNNRP